MSGPFLRRLLGGPSVERSKFDLRSELVRLQEKHERAQQQADLGFHEAALLDGLAIAGMPFRPLYLDCLERTGTTVPPWKRLRRAQRAYQLARYAEATAALPGGRAECGVLRGLSSLLIAATLRKAAPAFDFRDLYLIDSFEGLSGMHPADAVRLAASPGPQTARYSMREGAFGDTSAAHVREVMAGHADCAVVQGWIPEVLESLPDTPWAFVHLDVDLYEPTLGALEYFVPRLAPGAVVINDDYLSPLFPGAGQAWDEYFEERGLPFVPLDSGQAVFVNRA
jgi:O-methyltransferase